MGLGNAIHSNPKIREAFRKAILKQQGITEKGQAAKPAAQTTASMSKAAAARPSAQSGLKIEEEKKLRNSGSYASASTVRNMNR
jgi:hypothetical protein